MKYLITILFALSLLFAGCWPECPVAPDIQTIVQKTSWIHLGSNNSLKIEENPVVVKSINGSDGGFIDYLITLNGVEITGQLVIPPNAFSGTLEISTTFDENNTTFTFGPANTQFSIPLILNIQYRGVDLSGLNPPELDFYYIDNGTFVKANYQKLYVKPGKGELRVVDASIDHFSRYGFAK